ncbi:MAG: hypothetical protein L0H63_06055 [Nitrococcus sp.]|nr:hypothetical protein [Nitrococcus sp.]
MHDLKAALYGYQVHAPAQVDGVTALYLGGKRPARSHTRRQRGCLQGAARYEDTQVDFKGKGKGKAMDNESFRRGMTNTVFGPTYETSGQET